ncbi:alpha/beta fold hydrolase [Longimicrobium sp.]|uniref:alpha/beta fold hydrolase n=1 Tax=Longimicrobium sp. TaxID=2029185 RepID=UPI002BCED081|nr:alpha/beta fold hydrolase [Longimicrobium sp.]HSU15852.1 alpha/beta fold hydrolase [Longimicrobium sp.]
MGDATVELHADDGGAGDGLPVVFLHSLAGNTRHWEAQLAHLRASRRAVALDWRGHGRSGAAPDGGWSPAEMARDVAAAVDRLGLARFVLAGHSAGGLVALAYAGMHPERVAGLFLLDPSGDMRRVPAEMIDPFLATLEGDGYQEAIDAYWRGIAGADPAVRDRLLADLRATPRATVAGILRALRDLDVEALLRGYRGLRISITTPQNDGPMSLHVIDPSLAHRMVTGTGHWIQLDRPEEVNRMLDEFIAEVEAAV